MSNVHQTGETPYLFGVSMELYARFANAAKAKRLPISEHPVKLMKRASEGISITPTQANDMAQRMKALYLCTPNLMLYKLQKKHPPA